VSDAPAAGAGLPPAVGGAVTAARAGDDKALDALVDWSRSGIGALLGGLGGVDPDDRGAVLRRGLADLESTDRSTRAGALGELRRGLARAARIAAAGSGTRDELLHRIAGAEVPPDLAAAEREVLAALLARAAEVTEVYEAVADDGAAYAFAVTPGGGALVVPPPGRS